jgi:heme exporter protein D
MTLGPYASFIIMSYVAVATVVTALVIWVIADYRSQKARLRDLEAAGAVRRSGRSAVDVK